MDYNLDDYIAAFLVVFQGEISRRGIMMASEGHFTATADNAHGMAVAAARRMFQERLRHRAEVEPTKSIKLTKKSEAAT